MKQCMTFAIILLFLASAAVAQENKAQAAQKSAEGWLALVDKADYPGSYDQAASLFKEHVTKDDWVHLVKPVREPLGKVVSRKLQNAQYTTSLPGAPDGEYVVVQFDTSFENKKSSVETVVPMLDKDGRWKVSGYTIK